MFRRNKMSQAIMAAVGVSAVSMPIQAQIKEIVVTATKRVESMQDVPVSVTALQGDSLEQLRIGNFQDYILYLPNVVSQGTGPGQSEIFIRGAATSQTQVTLSSVNGLQPSVALYQDEQPVALAGRNLDVYTTDIERIEVLPGPQGTLFGASSQAGTVRLITNKPNHGEFQAGLDFDISSTRGGDMSNSVEAYINVPVNDNLALRVAAYNDHQGGWIDNILNDPANGGYSGSAVVIDRLSGGVLADPDNTPVIAPQNDAFVEENFNDATYSGARFGLSYFINEDWDILLQHTQQSLDTEGVFAYDPNLQGDSSTNRFNPDENDDDFGLTTWTVNGRMAMLDMVYTGGYIDRDINASIDYTWYTNAGKFSAYYVCNYGGTVAPADETCLDPDKFYQENTENTRMTHEFRINTPVENRWRVTSGIFYDEQDLASTGLFKIASDEKFGPLARTLAAPAGTVGTRTDGGPFPPQISFINDVTRETDQIAVFGQLDFDITDDVTASFGARWYDIDDNYKGSTSTANVTARIPALAAGTTQAINAANAVGAAIGNPAPVLAAISSGQLDTSDLNEDGVLNASDTIFKASLDWQVSDNIMVFATWAEGFRPPVTNRVGGDLADSAGVNPRFANFRVPLTSRTDDLENYELGFKADLFDQRLRLNVTGYYSEITDLQTSRFDPTNINFLWFADNVGDAEIKGVDGDFIWAPTPDLTISGAFSLLDTEITRLNDELIGIAAPVGSKLPFSADFSGNVRARYNFDMGQVGGVDGMLGYLQGGISYKGESLAGMKMEAYVQEDVTQRVYGQGSGLAIKREASAYLGAPVGTDLLDHAGIPGGRYVQDDYALVNFAFGVTKDQWLAEFYVDNVFDESAALTIDVQQFTPKVVTNRPRTFGLRMSYDY